MKVKSITDLKPKTNGLWISWLKFISFFIIFAGVIAYHIYAIFLNWKPLFLHYDLVFAQMTDIGGFVAGLLEILIAPFIVFIQAFKPVGHGVMTGELGYGYELMYATIAEIVLVIASSITNIIPDVADLSYDPSKYQDYVVETLEIDLEAGTVWETRTEHTKEGQATAHSFLITTLVTCGLVFWAPITTLGFMVFYVGKAMLDLEETIKRYQQEMYMYNQLKDAKEKVKEPRIVKAKDTQDDKNIEALGNKQENENKKVEPMKIPPHLLNKNKKANKSEPKIDDLLCNLTDSLKEGK